MKKKNKKFDFYFPTEVLNSTDFSPVETSVLKQYYKNEFLELIEEVSKTLIIIYNKK